MLVLCSLRRRNGGGFMTGTFELHSLVARLAAAALVVLGAPTMLHAASKAPRGARCPHGNGDCASGFCDAGMGSGNTNTCVPRVGTGKVGDYCSQDAHCATKSCSRHPCEGKKPLGASCPGGNKECASGFCDAGLGSGKTNKCVPAAGSGGTGEYCSQDAHCRCASGFCDAGMGSGNTNMCVPRAGTGAPGQYCSQNGHCRPGKACVGHKCQ
jgi:hypothetical protein